MLLKKRHILGTVYRTTDEHVTHCHIFLCRCVKAWSQSQQMTRKLLLYGDNHNMPSALSLSLTHKHTQTHRSAHRQMERKRSGGERDDPIICPSRRKNRYLSHPAVLLRNIRHLFNNSSYLQCPLSDPYPFFIFFGRHLISHNLRLLFLKYSCK